MSANIGLSLSATKLEVAPGESVEATIIVRNQSQVIDQFGIRIQGLDPSWWTLSTSSVSLFPGDQSETKLTIHPPKEAEAKAGSYSFQVRAVSQANPEEMTEEEAYLILRGFQVWDVEMSPTKVAGTSGTYQITASNSGNTEITLIFEGKDPEEALDYTFRHHKVSVPAGESALVTLKVRPKKGERGKLYSFQVLVSPAEAKVPSREVKTINGELEYQRRRCPWRWILLGLALVAAAILALKFIPPLLQPSLPVINSFTASATSISTGDSVTLSWSVSGATEVTIDHGIGSVGLTGTHTVSATTTTTYTLEASNEAGSRTATVKVTVSAPLPTLPVINSFTASPTSITSGDSVTLSWTVSGATAVTIDQGIGSVDLTGTRTVSPTTTTTYTLRASNEAGSTADTVKVTVTAAPLPDLTITTGSPTVTPSTVAPEGTVSLSAFTVKNQGSADSGFFSIGFYLSTDSVITASDTILTNISYSNLAAGAQRDCDGRTLAIPIGTPSGNHYIGILVDRTNAVSESNEANNYVARQITVGPTLLPDLTITTGSPTVTPSTVAPGGTVSLSAWTVKNQGSANSGSFSNGFYLSADSVITASDTYLTGNSNSNLAPGGQFNWGGPTLTIPSGTPSGNYYIGILVDRTNGVSESNETNNYVARLITVSAPLIVYDFVAQASSSSTYWSGSSADERLTFGDETEGKGRAYYCYNAVLEDNRTYDKVLFTHPPPGDDTHIGGTYIGVYLMGYRVEAGDRFYAKVGFIKGALEGNVRFRVMIRPEGGTNKWIADFIDTCDGNLRTMNIDLSLYAGKRADFILQVDCNGSSRYDWATWVEAKIIR